MPATPDALPGPRAAALVRESTAGQYDNFGPDAQREHISGAIERFGLTATGIEMGSVALGSDGSRDWRMAAMAKTDVPDHQPYL